MSVFVVDASVIGSTFLPDEAEHASSARFLSLARQRRESVVLPMILLPEIGSIIGRRLNRPELTAPLLRHLLRGESFRLAAFERPEAFAAADLAAQTRLRAADAVYTALAFELGATLVTLDRQQMERAASQVDVATPDEMIRRWLDGPESDDVSTTPA